MLAHDVQPVFGLFSAFAFVLGSCIGSFMNVVVWRLPRGESLLYPPSHCPKCGHAIRAWENIPILSWLCLRARCSGCHQPISIRYPLGEGATGLLFWILWWRSYQMNLPLDGIPGTFFLTGALLAAALIDAEHWFIPDQVTYSGMLVAVLLAMLLPGGHPVASMEMPRDAVVFSWAAQAAANLGLDLHASPIFAALADSLLGLLAGLLLLGGFSWALRLLVRGFGGRDRAPIGRGDVKLLGMVGAFLGADATVFILLGAASLGFFYALALGLLRRRAVKAIPFGPFLAIAAFLWMVW